MRTCSAVLASVPARGGRCSSPGRSRGPTGTACTPCRRHRARSYRLGKRGTDLRPEAAEKVIGEATAAGADGRVASPTRLDPIRQTRIGNGAAAPFSLTKPRHVLSQRKNCTRRAQIPMRALVLPLDSSAEDKAAFPAGTSRCEDACGSIPIGYIHHRPATAAEGRGEAPCRLW